ncbi:class I SAM-dependent methyltransferase [Candidatus Nitrosopelagicus sp.]|nr:class I SAM-dependent methyltransferase [Candidatus Nitrosopelagicus sp.]
MNIQFSHVYMDDENFVKKSYLDVLGRDVDSNSLTSLTSQLKEKIISHDDLIDILKKSDELRASFPPLNRNWLSSIDWTKSQWNERLTESEFFQEKNLESGEIYYSLIINELESKLGNIFQRKNFLDMKILEIGCGTGQVLEKMSKIFGQVIGVDISIDRVRTSNELNKNSFNCQIYENNGIDLSIFSNDLFDFCYIVESFRWIPSKKIVSTFIQEVSRVLKKNCLFKFQVRGKKDDKLLDDKWQSVRFSSEEIFVLAQNNNFEVIDTNGENTENYWITLQLN